MIKSLRKKFILINMLLVSLVLIIVFSALCIVNHKRLEYESTRILNMVLIRGDDQIALEYEIGQTFPPDFMKYPIFVVNVNGKNGVSLITSHNISISDEMLGLLSAKAEASSLSDGILGEYNLRYMKRYEPDGLRIAFIDISGNNTMMRHIIMNSVLLFALSVTAFFLISLFLSRWALRPAERAWRQQKQFVADASHELKTPLTVILANIGILKSNSSDTIDKQIGWVKNTEAEAERMKKLVENLLFLAKTDDAKTLVIHTKVNFSDVVLGSALAFESVAYHERGVMIDTNQITPDIYVLGDQAQLSQLSGILLDNAVKYSESNGVVTLSLTTGQGKAIFTVHNKGSYLNAEDLKHIFDRFYRADTSRSNEGYGLGLAISKSIAESHHGKVLACSNKDEGTIFTVVIPILL